MKFDERLLPQPGPIHRWLVLLLLMPLHTATWAQEPTVQDDFEGNGTIDTWAGDDCGLNTTLANPYQNAGNPSATVLEYHDTGGAFANVYFDVPVNFDLSQHHTFSLKIYVPSSGLTGNAPHQVSLKLQDGNLGQPWGTQSEIIEGLALDQWQTLTFDFAQDNYINLDASSPPPTERSDFNRVLIQVNGENNNAHVLAYLDDVSYDGTLPVDTTSRPIFDQLVWSDEFEGSGAIDTSQWFHQTLLPLGDRWYNGEIQHYTDREANTFLADGHLNLVARRETFTDQGITKDFTSARLNSKFAFTYGRVEVRAKMPIGPGTWPAIWTLGQNIDEPGAYWKLQGLGTTPWPACGEMDIMEHWGTNQGYVSSATHTPSSFGATVNLGGQIIPTVSSDFHVYAMDWYPDKLVFAVDGNVHFVYQPERPDAATWPFDAPQYLLLNVAILPSIASGFTESAMKVDYVRVYQASNATGFAGPSASEVALYPNPVADHLTLDLPPTSVRELTLYLYDLQGQRVATFSPAIEGQRVRLTGLDSLPQGLYVLAFTLDQQAYHLRVAKQ